MFTEEGWELFRRKAFADGAVLKKGRKTIAKENALKGLPLAFNYLLRQ